MLTPLRSPARVHFRQTRSKSHLKSQYTAKAWRAAQPRRKGGPAGPGSFGDEYDPGGSSVPHGCGAPPRSGRAWRGHAPPVIHEVHLVGVQLDRGGPRTWGASGRARRSGAGDRAAFCGDLAAARPARSAPGLAPWPLGAASATRPGLAGRAAGIGASGQERDSAPASQVSHHSTPNRGRPRLSRFCRKTTGQGMICCAARSVHSDTFEPKCRAIFPRLELHERAQASRPGGTLGIGAGGSW